MNDRESGLALLCDAGGMILDVLRNDLDLAGAIPGHLFIRLADSDSRVKAMSFLVEIKQIGSVLNREWVVPHPAGARLLHFSGGQVGEQILIVGATDGHLAAHLFEDMMQVNNEQTNLLRAVTKDQRQIEANLYDEISRLNNELVSMQRELAKKNAELERLNQEKNRFLGMAAHDLRNPLYGILLQSEFLLAKEQDLDQRECLEGIYAASNFLTRLVDDLLDVAKIEAGQLHLERETVDLEALVRRNVTHNRLLATQKQIEIDLVLEPLPPAVVDASKIEQVLNNLIGNAVKFSPLGGRVTVRLERAETDFCLTVSDQGPGIDPKDQEALFQPFHRSRARGTGNEKNTGLGLMIVKRIVTGHGGRIWLESRVGEGTTFFVLMPLHPTEGQ